MLAYFISHTLFVPWERWKIEYFHVFDIHRLYWTSRYALVKVDVTERNDVTKRHGSVLTIWRTSVVERTALSKTHFQKWKVCEQKNLSRVWGTNRKIGPSSSQSDITRQASWCQTVILWTDFFIFLSTPHTVRNSYIIQTSCVRWVTSDYFHFNDIWNYKSFEYNGVSPV